MHTYKWQSFLRILPRGLQVNEALTRLREPTIEKLYKNEIETAGIMTERSVGSALKIE